MKGLEFKTPELEGLGVCDSGKFVINGSVVEH